jgi:tRNA pseudouridine55 synthase
MSPAAADSALAGSGILLVDKPRGPTSHDLVEALRRALPAGARVGHTGTLDPLATGLLVLCLGAATRLARFLTGLDKEYLAEVRLGQTTDTYDADGAVISAGPVPALSAADLEAVLQPMLGVRRMVPPPFSAKKRGGQRLYRAARRGQPIAAEPVEVRVDALELLGFDGSTARLRIRCSAGTYVRALAHELGQALGCGGHLRALHRTAVGGFRVADALSLALAVEAAAGGTLASHLIAPAAALPQFPLVSLDRELLWLVAHGGDIEVGRGIGADDRYVRLVDPAGALVAVAECRIWTPGRSRLHPIVVVQAF